jgi:hypothetical protein
VKGHGKGSKGYNKGGKGIKSVKTGWLNKMVRLLHYLKAGDDTKVAELVLEYSGHGSVVPLLESFKECSHEGYTAQHRSIVTQRAMTTPPDICTMMWAYVAYVVRRCVHTFSGARVQ